MTAYLNYTKSLAEQTPPERNRVVDAWRVVAILVVMFGHWLAASIWLMPDDEIRLMNSLEWIPYAGWVTWIVQVMPIFFFVGGYANARALSRSGEVDHVAWITSRVRRLFTPVIPLVLVWTVLIVVLGPFLPSDVVRAGAMSATVPLWFISVYVSLTALAPFTHSWWRRHGLLSLAVLCVASMAVDLARFAFDVPGIGWVNFLFVWAAVHQVGYWWADRDTDGPPISAAFGWAFGGVWLAALIAVTWIGWYPVAMVGVPGAELTNMTPPTFAIAMLGGVQMGVVWATKDAMARRLASLRSWHRVVSVSGVMMTLYLWHLTAMTLVASVFLFAFDGAVFRVEPGTTLWWATRPLWIASLGIVTIGLVLLFARYEWRINKDRAPRRASYLLVGLLLLIGSAAAISYFGLATNRATVNWIIPISTLVGAGIVGAYPRRSRRDDGERSAQSSSG